MLRLTGIALCLLLVVLAVSACRVERVDREAEVPLTDRDDSTLRSGSYDPSPGGGYITDADRPGAPEAPNPYEANPPGVDDSRSPPARALPDDRLMIPVAGVRRDQLVDTFTEARSQGREHNAIDILAPRGRPVVAAMPGEVLRLFRSERGGLTIYKRAPGENLILYYAHLDGYHPRLQEGQHVARGDTLGYVGDTGNAPPGVTHLHFAMWVPESPESFWDGEVINPYPLLRYNRPVREAAGG
jgi:peptidoglycan LD-endopeptidase LytH